MVTLNAAQARSGVEADLVKQIALKMLQHEAVSDAIPVADPATQVTLNMQAQKIRDEITTLKAQIEQFRRASTDPVVSERAWRVELPKIDFKAPVEVFKAVLGKMPRDCGAALFLMQDGIASAASLCVKRMIAELGRPLDLVLHPRFSGAIPSPRELMQALAGYLKVVPDRDADALAADVVRALVDSLIPGWIVWLDLECNSAANAAEFLGWFLEKLWCPLVQALPGRAGAARFAQVFAVIVYNVPMDTGRLEADWLCGPDTFHPQRFVRVPLEPTWRVSDISEWLIQYTDAPRAGIDIDVEALSIYEMCREGVPEIVLGQLERFLVRALAATACLI